MKYENSFLLDHFVVEFNRPKRDIEKRIIRHIQECQDSRLISDIERNIKDKLNFFASGHKSKLLAINSLKFELTYDHMGEILEISRERLILARHNKHGIIETPQIFVMDFICKIYRRADEMK